VVNKADNTVSILDLKERKEVAEIETGRGPHEVAISPDGKLAVAGNYGDQQPNNTLSVINIATRKVISTIDLGEHVRPHGIEFIDNTRGLVTSETKGALLSVNFSTGDWKEVTQTGQTAGHMVAYSMGDSYAYVANIASGTVSKIDIQNNQLIQNIELKKGIEGIDVAPGGGEIWVANRVDSTVTSVNTNSYEITAVLPAHRVAFRVKVLPNGKYAMVSNGESGNLSVYNVNKKRWITDIDLFGVNQPEFPDVEKDTEDPPIPVGIATSTDSNYVFVACANYDLVAIVETENWTLAGTIKTGKVPDGIYYGPAIE